MEGTSSKMSRATSEHNDRDSADLRRGKQRLGLRRSPELNQNGAYYLISLSYKLTGTKITTADVRGWSLASVLYERAAGALCMCKGRLLIQTEEGREIEKTGRRASTEPSGTQRR